MRVTVACPKGRVKETESPHGVDFRMLYSNCVMVRTLTVLTVSGVRGRTLIWQGRMYDSPPLTVPSSGPRLEATG